MLDGWNPGRQTDHMVRRFGSQSGTETLEEGRVVVHGLLAEAVFGPVDSRRYGKSLGVNPFPPGEKICSFNCPYCECGWTNKLWVGVHGEVPWPSVRDILSEIESRLLAIREGGETLGAITFAGNGEPTLHPDFPALIDGTLALRDRLAPNAKVVVLTNATELGRPDVREALLRVEEPCMKLDAVSPQVVRLLNKPHASVDMARIIDGIAAFPSPIIQSMFVRGAADNTGEEEINLWLEALKRIRPARVDIYSLDRTPPDRRLTRVPREDLDRIASRIRSVLSVPVGVY